jgi:hypothetical protein
MQKPRMTTTACTEAMPGVITDAGASAEHFNKHCILYAGMALRSPRHSPLPGLLNRLHIFVCPNDVLCSMTRTGRIHGGPAKALQSALCIAPCIPCNCTCHGSDTASEAAPAPAGAGLTVSWRRASDDSRPYLQVLQQPSVILVLSLGLHHTDLLHLALQPGVQQCHTAMSLSPAGSHGAGVSVAGAHTGRA